MSKFGLQKFEDFKRVELQLPNGAVLKSRYIYQKGRFWQTYTMVRPGTAKEKLPLVGCLSSDSNQHLFAYDFDKLPQGIGTWEELVAILEDLPGLMVGRSPSGKVKAFIVFNWTGVPDKRAVIERANELLPEGLQGTFDHAGAFQFYLSKEISDTLEGMSEALVFDWSAGAGNTHSNIVEDTSISQQIRTFSYHLADLTSIPGELNSFINPGTRNSEARLKFCRILVAAFRLADKGGFGLPVASLAEACGVDATTVSAWLKSLRNAGFLVCVSSSYIVGLKAKHYEARGPLREAIVKRKETYSYAAVLPRRVPKDGEFYKFFLHLSKKVPVLRDYKLVIENIPGIMEKNRYQQALSVFHCDRRKESKGDRV